MAKLFGSEKHVFWQALIAALIIFNFGIFLGYMLESSRVGKVSKLYAESELALLDIKIQAEIFNFDIMDLNCTAAIRENINFADKVYEEAKILQKFEDSSTLTENIKLQHKKYDLLRTLFWINSMKIKKKCNASYHNVVYFYKFNDVEIEEKAKNKVFSNLLNKLKEKYGNEIMLIPIAGDNNLASIEVFKHIYNVTSLPTILIDEKIKITELTGIEEIERSLQNI